MSVYIGPVEYVVSQGHACVPRNHTVPDAFATWQKDMRQRSLKHDTTHDTRHATKEARHAIILAFAYRVIQKYMGGLITMFITSRSCFNAEAAIVIFGRLRKIQEFEASVATFGFEIANTLSCTARIGVESFWRLPLALAAFELPEGGRRLHGARALPGGPLRTPGKPGTPGPPGPGPRSRPERPRRPSRGARRPGLLAPNVHGGRAAAAKLRAESLVRGRSFKPNRCEPSTVRYSAPREWDWPLVQSQSVLDLPSETAAIGARSR